MRCPRLASTAIISDDARLAAQLSCLVAKPDTYVPVLDGPRLGRPDRSSEVLRRLNATARTRSQEILLAALSEEAVKAITDLAGQHRKSRLRLIQTWQDSRTLNHAQLPEVLSWGRSNIGVGLLKALRRGCAIKFSEKDSPGESVEPLFGHLVVCEDGHDLAQVIAANYAYSIGAGLVVISPTNGEFVDPLLERFYGLYDDRSSSATDTLEELKATIRKHCSTIPMQGASSVTFIGSGLPYGFAFPEVPSTHLFDYPDLGIAVANGFASQQPRSRGIDVAVLVDPKTTDAPEIRTAAKLLPERGIFTRCYEGEGATVRNVTEMIELYPYDLLVFATHCGDVPGYRWTYEYTDSEGIARNLVVDIAIGIAGTDDDNLLHVTQFMRFISLDGVDWNDPRKKERLHVGTAITTFMDRTRAGAQSELKPTKKENISRVVGSAALKMYDHNYLSLPRSIADEGTPVVLNNACCSWHQLAMTFAVSGARAYLGTLFPVLTSEADSIATAILGQRFGEVLPAALWGAQQEAFGNSVRRPYLMTGIYPQSLRVRRHDVPGYLAVRLTRASADWHAHSSSITTDEKTSKDFQQRTDYYRRELQSLNDNWLKPQTVDVGTGA